MIPITAYDGVIIPVSGTWPYGAIKDDPNGTAANAKSNSDLQQFFQRIMANAGISPNGNPDNATNGFQLVQALNKLYNMPDGALAGFAGASGFAGTIASGMVKTVTGVISVSAGYFFYNKQLVQMIGGSQPMPALGLDIYILIGNKDGLPIGNLVSLSNTTGNTATTCLFSSLVSFSKAIGIDDIITNLTDLFNQVERLYAAPYVNATLVSGWAAGASTPAYTINGLGEIWLRGVVTNPSNASPGPILFTLPLGFKPQVVKYLSVTAYNGSAYIPGEILITTAGVVQISNFTPAAVNCSISLDGLRFDSLA